MVIVFDESVNKAAEENGDKKTIGEVLTMQITIDLSVIA